MNRSFILKTDNIILFTISFFLYTGYYAGLELIISLGLKDFSRYYSVPIRLLILLLISYFLFKRFNKRINKKYSIFFFMLMLFFVDYSMMVFINMGAQDYMLNSFEYIFYLLTWTVIVFLYFCFLDLKKINLTLVSMIYAGFLMGVISFLLYGSFFLSGGGRISQMMYEDNNNFISPLVLSYSAVLNFIVYYCYLKSDMVKKKFTNIIATLMLFFSIPMFVLGASRGAFIACALCMAYVWIFSNIKIKISSMIVIPVFIYLVYWISVSTGNNAFDRFLNIKSDVESGSSSASRLDIWATAWDYFLKSPIYGGYLEVDGKYPHNIFFEVLMNTGIFGFVLFLIPFLFLAYNGLVKVNIKYGYFIPLLFILGLSMHLFSGAIYFAPILFAALGLIFNQLNALSCDVDKIRNGT